MLHEINPTLLDIAAWSLDVQDMAAITHRREKKAFVPAGGDPAAAGGAPPPGGDPTAAGGDPMAAMMGGGAPPGGAMPPAGGGIDPSMIQQIVQATLQAQGGAPAAGGAGGAAGPAGVGMKIKVDPTMMYMQLGRLTKLMIHMYERMGWELPPDTLNDDLMIQQAAGQASATGGAPGAAAPSSPPGGGAAPAGPQAIPGIGQSPAIQPIEPAGGAPKTAEDNLPAGMADVNFLDAAYVLDHLLEHAQPSCSV